MNEKVILDACRLLSFRQAARIHGVSRTTWDHVRKHGTLPKDGRGRNVNQALTQAILDLVKAHPEYSEDRVCLEIGTCKYKVSRVFKEHGLSHLWQRLRYADVVLKELDPDLVKARAKEATIKADGPGALVPIDAKRYGALQGGILIVGLTVVDNFSGFTTGFLCPDGSKSGQNSVAALSQFRERFPAPWSSSIPTRARSS